MSECTTPVAAPPPRPDFQALTRVPGYPQILAGSALWHAARWCGFFVTTLLLTRESGSPLVPQAAGAVFFAPMLFGGILAGGLSDRVDRRTLMAGCEAALVPAALAVAMAIHQGSHQVLVAFAFMLTLGSTTLIEGVALRPFLYDLVGPHLARHALTLDNIIQALASIAGVLLGGVLIDTIGVAVSFVWVAALLIVSMALLMCVPGLPPGPAPAGLPVPSRGHPRASARLLRSSPLLLGVVAVTAILNTFYYSFMPLLPTVAEEFSSRAVVASAMGVTASAGQFVTGVAIGLVVLSRTHLFFTLGALLSLIGLAIAVATPSFPVALVGLLAAGIGQAAFGSLQNLLVLESVDESERGVAVGLVSMAIGCMPLGLLLVGVAAELLTPRLAILGATATGIVALLCVAARSPVLLRNPEIDAAGEGA